MLVLFCGSLQVCLICQRLVKRKNNLFFIWSLEGKLLHCKLKWQQLLCGSAVHKIAQRASYEKCKLWFYIAKWPYETNIVWGTFSPGLTHFRALLLAILGPRCIVYGRQCSSPSARSTGAFKHWCVWLIHLEPTKSHYLWKWLLKKYRPCSYSLMFWQTLAWCLPKTFLNCT